LLTSADGFDFPQPTRINTMSNKKNGFDFLTVRMLTN